MIPDIKQKEIFDILLNSIIKIEDLSGNIISYNILYVDYIKNKYSATYSYILFIDNEPCVNTKRNYKITYKCRCGKENTILLRKFLLKTELKCQACALLKEYGELGHNNKKRIKDVKINNRTIFNINDESDNFKHSYELNHLSDEEFYKWLPFIYLINDILITPDNISKIKYLYAEPCNNQHKYTSKIQFDTHIETIKRVYLKCNICRKIHNVHIDHLRDKDINNIRCKQCTLVNTKFPIRLFKNTQLTYQSSIEYDFLILCEKYNINVENGKEIPYIWNHQNHTYISDFFLPDFNMIIETKSNHIYYRLQLLNGKQQAKNNGAVQYATEHNYEFRFLFDNMIQDFFNELQNRMRLSEQQ